MKKLIVVFVLLFVGLGAFAFWGYNAVVNTVALKSVELYVPTGSSYKDLKNQLLDQGVIEETESVDLASRVLRFRKKIRPGKYDIEKGTSVLDFCRMFRGARVSTVKVAFHNTRMLNDVASKVAKNIEADSLSLVEVLENETLRQELGIEGYPACYLIPNTYEFYWDTDAQAFVERMVKETNIFWNDERKKLAADLEMTACEVITLAAIVQEEQNQQLSEQKRIAGLYINRLRTGIPLQADPTLKFAAGDFSIKRVLNIHKEIESPYNTYLYAGLPPGPITIPEPGAIDAVLNYEKHEYVYMCAKEDFSGFHNFAKTLGKHNINAARYQRALSREMRLSRQ